MFHETRFARFNVRNLSPTQAREYDFTVICVATNPHDNRGEVCSRGLPSVKTKTDLSKSGSHRRFRSLDIARELSPIVLDSLACIWR